MAIRSSAAPFGTRAWIHFTLWLLAWNVVVPVRLLGMFTGSALSTERFNSAVGMLVLDQTTWGIATWTMFRLALRARHVPLRRVLTLLGALAIPLMVARHLVWDYSMVFLMGRPPQPAARALWYTGPLNLFLLIAAAALGLILVYVQRERDNAVTQATLKAELASAKLQTLRLQLNPHFLFNALNSIASLVPSDSAKADTAIAALSSFLRASLDVTRGEETTLENELRLVDAYLEIELLRFEWLTVDLDVPDALRPACVPAFVLQLLVENAIRHGLAPRRAPGRVLIAARREGERLELSVSDDGVGLGARTGDASLGAGLQIGLQNIRARLAGLHGGDATLTLESATPQGTVATIRVPYRVAFTESVPMPAVA